MSTKEAFSCHGGQQTGGAPLKGRRNAARNSGASSNDVPRTQQRIGEEAVGRRGDGVDNPGAPEAFYTTRDTSETWSLRRVARCAYQEGDIVKEMQNAGRFYSDLVENKPEGEGGTHRVLQRDAEGHREDPEDQDQSIEPSRPGEGRGAKDAQIDHRRREVLRAEHVDKSMQAAPNFRKTWADTQVADHLRS